MRLVRKYLDSAPFTTCPPTSCLLCSRTRTITAVIVERSLHLASPMTAGRANHTPATMTAGTLLSSSQGMRLAAARGTFSSAVRELDCPPSPRGNGKSVIVLMQA